MEAQNKYQNGKIYKIVDIGYNKCYIGSTIQALSHRMSKHRTNYINNLPNGTKARELFSEFGLENCKIELIENFPCNNKDELVKQEGYHIQSMTCVNKCIPRNCKEDVYKAYNESHKEQRQEYRDAHKDEKVVYDAAYHEANRDNIAARKNEIVMCVCGHSHRKGDKARHQRSKRHQLYLNKPNENSIQNSF